jgi:predicted nuclease of predicted toxin-antitoxin system
LTFLVDRSLGRALPERMREAGVAAIGLDERYSQNALDEVWLPDAGANGWIVLTKDHEIRRNFPEIDAIMVHRVGCFLLPKNLKKEEMISLALAVLMRMENICRSRAVPFIYVVYRDCRLERRDTEAWLKPWCDERHAAGLPPIFR